MRWVVDACYLLAAILLWPLLLYRSLQTGKYRRDWRERMGGVPTLPPGRPRVWIHAVSVGEVNSIQGLVAAWRERAPETEFVISSTTDTGIDCARSIYPDLTVVRYPLDFSPFASRALDRVQPTLVVLVELEVWYQFVTRAAARRIPVAVINGRITAAKSVKWFRLIRPVARRMFSRLAWVGAQDGAYADGFRQVGVPPDCITITGSMKWDTAQVADAIPGSDALARAVGLDPRRPTWVCGSTGPGEEEVILQAFRRLRERHTTLQLAIVPRKPERFEEVAVTIRRAGFEPVRRTASPDGPRREPAGAAVVLGDTMGELRKFYALADVVLVGRTLAKMGGSDMMEVAALARPVVVGPHTENFADTMAQLEPADAVCVVRQDLDDPDVAEALADAVGRWLDDPEAARRMGERGREVVARNRGATQCTLAFLVEIMQRAQHRAA